MVDSKATARADGRPTGLSKMKSQGTGIRVFTALIWLTFLAGVIAVASQDVGLAPQAVLALTTIVLMLVAHAVPLRGMLRIIVMVLAAFITCRYLIWRTLYTLPDVGSVSFIPGILLYAAELQGILLYFLGVFVNIKPFERRTKTELPDNETTWPTVDVFVPTFNEAPELLRVTLTAVTQISYPPEKLNVYLLDDGGTAEKRHDENYVLAAEAEERAHALMRVCDELGVQYLTRARNEMAKAGNINAALPRTSGDLILILDADHVPTQEILLESVGAFVEDPEVALVQTPHFFATPDPIERNLGTFQNMPSENEMFYRKILQGLDSWNAAFFCGSAGVLRRSHLEMIGGMSGETVTEDAETALELHSRGLRSRYIDKPMIAGLQPETLQSFVRQRTRWAEGMTQILIKKNPLLKRGLNLGQRLCYLNTCLFWLFPFSRLTFLLAPFAFLFFGLRIFEATIQEFVVFTLAHVVSSFMLTNLLFGRYRWPLVSEVYELLQAPAVLKSVVGVMLRPSAPVFHVTPKSEDLRQNFLSPISTPFLIFLGFITASIAVGLYRYFSIPLEREHLFIVLGWSVVNLVIALAAFGACYERVRAGGLVQRSKPANLVDEFGTGVAGTILQMNMSHAQLQLEAADAVRMDLSGGQFVLQAFVPRERTAVDFNCYVAGRDISDGQMSVDVAFSPQSQEEEESLVQLCFGDSENWNRFQLSRHRRRSFFYTALRLFFIGLARSLEIFHTSFSGNRARAAAQPATVQERITYANGETQ